MAKKKLTAEQEQEIKILRANNEMLERTMKEMEERGSSDLAMKQIETARQEVLDHIASIDKEEAKSLLSKPSVKKESTEIGDSTIFEMLQAASTDKKEIVKKEETKKEAVKKEEPKKELAVSSNDDLGALQVSETVVATDAMYNTADPTLQYDVIQLPSKGQGYRTKVDRVPVGYLTAYDENFITSPNLYRDGLVIDFLLKNKIMNDAIDVDELLSGDADAIILFLRATSYGVDFPIVVRDPDSGEQIETTVDLSTLKTKEFNLVGDENGWFDYETTMRKDKIKFRYLTRKQEKTLRRVTELEGYGTKAALIESDVESLTNAISVDDVITSDERQDITKALKSLSSWSARLREKNDSAYNKIITNNLLMQVMSVNGNTDKEYIRKYVNSMPARESLALRRYINNNTPGIDFEITVERPKSLGGGSFKTFLNWDDSVFLNISDV